MIELTAKELAKKIEENSVLLVDIRRPDEYKKNHFPNSIHIDFYDDDFEMLFKELPLDKHIVLYCQNGNRSALALTFLESIDITNASHLQGGITAWLEQGYTI
jgi:rhodanese-related sulfurtransferase